MGNSSAPRESLHIHRMAVEDWQAGDVKHEGGKKRWILKRWKTKRRNWRLSITARIYDKSESLMPLQHVVLIVWSLTRCSSQLQQHTQPDLLHCQPSRGALPWSNVIWCPIFRQQPHTAPNMHQLGWRVLMIRERSILGTRSGQPETKPKIKTPPTVKETPGERRGGAFCLETSAANQLPQAINVWQSLACLVTAR